MYVESRLALNGGRAPMVGRRESVDGWGTCKRKVRDPVSHVRVSMLMVDERDPVWGKSDM